ncbi:MAG: DUF427 domain-containing protein [Planctomycetota bacterium]
MRRPANPQPAGPGEESVWDYPRPPRLEPTDKPIRVEFGGRVIAETTGAYRVLETSHAPTYYLPPEDVDAAALSPGRGRSFCEWKGVAEYRTVTAGDVCAENAAWFYPAPTGVFAPIAGYLAFYARLMDACWVDGERAQPQPGGFYGGWVTSDLVGPIKGEPGTEFW